MTEHTPKNYGLDVPIQNHDPALALNPSRMAKQIHKIALSKMKLKKPMSHRHGPKRTMRKTPQRWY